MIRVNLANSRIAKGVTETHVHEPEIHGPANRDSLVKIAMIMLFTIAIMMYENSEIQALNQEQASVQSQLTQLQADLASKEAEVEGIRDIESQAKELEDKLKILKSLSKLRLREVKTLDFVQSAIPDKVWIKDIKFESNKEKLEQGDFTFEGSAVSTEDLSEFVKRLENSAYMSDVIVVKNVDMASNQSNSIRSFLFTAEVEQAQ